MKVTSKPIAVILIRSGSRGLVDKNIKPLAGKPLVFRCHHRRIPRICRPHHAGEAYR